VIPYLIRSVSLRHLLREPLRTLLILFGIALGVAVFVSVRIANVSALAAFRQTLSVISGSANLTVRGVDAPIPDALFPKVWETPRVLGAAPRVTGTVPLLLPSKGASQEDERASLLILGIDPFTQADLDAVPYAQSGNSNGGDTSFFTRRDGIILSDSFARRYGLKAGETVRAMASGETKPLYILSVLPSDELARAYGGDVGVMDIANAQELLHKVGRLDRIDLRTADADRDRVAAAIRKILPRGLTVAPPSERVREAEKMVSAFQLNLTALSMISALVGVFIIYNALLIAVLKRRKEIATLRSLGVTRGGIAAQFLTEAALLGIVGSALGLGLGIWLAQFTLQAISGTISALYLQVRARQIVLDPLTLMVGAGLGIGSALAAGLFPALEAASTPPAETLREATAARPTRRRAGPWLLTGLLLLALAGISSAIPALRAIKLVGFADAFMLILGSALTTPAFIVGLGDVTQKAYLRLFGAEGELAVHEIRAALDRSAAVVAALSVAVAMSIGLEVMVGSFRQTVQAWIGETISADLYIGAADQDVSGSDAILPTDLLKDFQNMPGVAGTDIYRTRPISISGKMTHIAAPSTQVLGEFGGLLFRKGDSRAILTGITGKPEAIVSETFSRRFNAGEGDSIRCETPIGPVSLKIRGVFYDYTSDQGVLMLDHSVYARLWDDPSISNVAYYLKPGVSPESVRQELLRRIHGKYALRISDNRTLRANILNIFDQTFAITYALQFIAVLVAMLGIGNALLAILLQRRREIGILRAVGATKAQVARISLLEASLMATWGHLIGCISGILLALLLVYVINREFFGWTLQFRLTASPFLLTYLLVLGSALVAAAIPARVAAGTPVAEAVRTE
jgi:putative ABC transport system permease protein